jgi:tetratricopeptide (TPR) repeat protein
MQPSRRDGLRWAARLGGSALLGLGALSQGGCAAAQTSALHTARPADVPERVRLTHVPFFPQADTLCGPAALAMLLGAAGQPADVASLSPEVYLPQRQGSLTLEMTGALRRHGLLPYPLAPSLADALRELAAGHAVLLLLNLALPIWPRWHYAVLTGYDLATQTAWLHSGEQADVAWNLNTLEFTWARSQHWALVALPAAQLPASAQPGPLAQALLSLEQVRGPALALPGWLAMVQRWPAELLPRLAAGNSLLSLNRPAEAAQHYQAAAAAHHSAAAWNNLAVALAQLGEREAARAALAQAQARAEQAEPNWRAAVAATRQELGL